MSVQREEELKRVLVEDLDCRVQQRDSEQLAVRAISDAEDVVRHFECSYVHEGQESDTSWLGYSCERSNETSIARENSRYHCWPVCARSPRT